MAASPPAVARSRQEKAIGSLANQLFRAVSSRLRRKLHVTSSTDAKSWSRSNAVLRGRPR